MMVGGIGWFRRLGVACALGATLVVAGCDTPEERARSHYERALALVAEGVDEKAAIEFRNALRLRRDYAEAHFDLGKLYERRGNLRAAAGSFRAVVEAQPENGEAQLRLGQIMMLGGDLAAAGPHIEAAVRLRQDDPNARSANAALLVRRGDAAAAGAEAQAALILDPAHVPAHVVLASIRADAGDVAGALEIIEARLAVQPDEQTYQLIKLQLLERQGDQPGVGAQLEQLVARFPDEVQFRRMLAQWRFNNGDFAGAETDLRALADVEGAEGVMRLVAFLARQHGEEAARAELAARADAATDPLFAAELRQSLAELEIRSGRLEEGRAILRALVAEKPSIQVAHAAQVRLAFSELAEGNKIEARRLVEEVIAEDAENSEALAIRASIAIDELRPDDAIADLRVALRGDPDNARYMLLEATAHERRGDAAATGERFAAAARTSSFEPEIALRYAQFLRGRGDLTAAEAALSESVRRHANDRRTLSALAEVRLLLEDWVGADVAAGALRGLEGGAGIADQVTAASLNAQGRIQESIALLEGVAASAGEGSSAVSRLVLAYVRAGEVDRAVALVDDLLVRKPDDIRALILRAELHLQKGAPEAAVDLLRRVTAAAPQSPIGYLALGRVEASRGRLEEAERFAREGIAKATRPESLRLLLAQLLERRGDFTGAIAEYQILHVADPDSVIVANNLASLIAEHQAEDPAALALADRVAQRLRGYDAPEFKDTYGWVRFLSGDASGALAPVREAAEALPGNPIVRYHAGRIYAELGQVTLAREHLQAALDLDPAFPKAESARTVLAGLPAGQ